MYLFAFSGLECTLARAAGEEATDQFSSSWGQHANS